MKVRWDPPQRSVSHDVVTLKSLVNDALQGFKISIGAPYGFSGSVWNEGENANVKIYVSNYTGFTLRDVVVRIYAYGSVKIDPIYIFGIPLLDGEESWDEMDAGDSDDFVVRLKGKYDGNGYLYAYVSAEVVPYSTVYKAMRSIKIYQA